MVRLFLAISLPDEVKARLSALQKELARSGADVRWVRPEGIHLTLKFFGEVSEVMINPLAETAKRVVEATKPGVIHLGVKGMGTFPAGARPRVVWAGLVGDLQRLARLQHQLEKAFAQLGFAPEKRPFVPHLTLGRVKSGRRVDHLLRSLKRYEDEEFASPQEIEVKDLVLYQSTLKPSGAVYTPLRRVSLV